MTVQRELKVKLDVTLPAGDHEMKLYLMFVPLSFLTQSRPPDTDFLLHLPSSCDSYLGADQTFDLPRISVAEGEDSDEDSSDEDDDME